MKLNALEMKHGLRKSVAIDVASALVHSVPKLTEFALIWKKALTLTHTVPTSIRASNMRVSSALRLIQVGPTLPDTVLRALPNLQANLQVLTEYIIDKFPNEYDDKHATVKQKVAMAYLSLAFHLYDYIPEYVNNQLLILRALEKGENFVITQRQQYVLDDGLSTFSVALDLLGVSNRDFVHRMNQYPEVPATNNVDALLMVNESGNPLARVKDGFRGNPFFTIGMWANTVIVDYVSYTEDRLRVAKLYLEELRAEQSGHGSPANAREIELLEDEISDLQYKIVKATR
jgi:hypothetical protein